MTPSVKNIKSGSTLGLNLGPHLFQKFIMGLKIFHYKNKKTPKIILKVTKLLNDN